MTLLEWLARTGGLDLVAAGVVDSIVASAVGSNCFNMDVLIDMRKHPWQK